MTFLGVAAAILSRQNFRCNAQPDTWTRYWRNLRDAGADIEAGVRTDCLTCTAKRPKAVNNRTAASGISDRYAGAVHVAEPGGSGTGFTETVFENRPLRTCSNSAAWARAEIESNTVICHGVERSLAPVSYDRSAGICEPGAGGPARKARRDCDRIFITSIAGW